MTRKVVKGKIIWCCCYKDCKKKAVNSYEINNGMYIQFCEEHDLRRGKERKIDIVDEFAWLIKEYVIDDSKLTKDAIELKQRIINVLGQERKQKLEQIELVFADLFETINFNLKESQKKLKELLKE